MTDIGNTKFSKIFLWEEVKYEFSIKSSKEFLTFLIEKELDVNYYVKEFKYSELQKDFPFLFMSQQKFFQFVIESFELNEFKFSTDGDNNKRLNFWIEIGKGKFEEKYDFYITLENKIRDIPNNIERISSFVQIIDNKYEGFKNSIDAKFKDLEMKLDSKTQKFLDDIIEENKTILTNLSKELKEFNDHERKELENQRFKLCRDYSLLMKNVENEKIIIEGKELYPKLTENLDNNNALMSNDFRTFEKKIAGYRGIRSNPIQLELDGSDVYKFSIRIDKCHTNCHIMLGYCLSTHNGNNGFYNSNCLAMLYLHSGLIYCPSLGNAQLAFRATKGMTITAVIDISNKFVVFFANGNQVVHPRSFTLNDEDNSKICACVDLNTVGDTFSIIEY